MKTFCGSYRKCWIKGLIKSCGTLPRNMHQAGPLPFSKLPGGCRCRGPALLRLSPTVKPGFRVSVENNSGSFLFPPGIEACVAGIAVGSNDHTPPLSHEHLHIGQGIFYIQVGADTQAVIHFAEAHTRGGTPTGRPYRLHW